MPAQLASNKTAYGFSLEDKPLPGLPKVGGKIAYNFSLESKDPGILERVGAVVAPVLENIGTAAAQSFVESQRMGEQLPGVVEALPDIPLPTPLTQKDPVIGFKDYSRFPHVQAFKQTAVNMFLGDLPEGLGKLQKPAEKIVDFAAQYFQTPEEEAEWQKAFPNLMAVRYALSSLLPAGEKLASAQDREAFRKKSPEEQHLEILGETAGWALLPAFGPAQKAVAGKLVQIFPWMAVPLKAPNWIRRLSNKDRGLALQSLEETIAKNPNMSEAEVLRTWNNPTWREQALAKRIKPEAPTGEAITPEPVIDLTEPIKPFDVTQVTPPVAEIPQIRPALVPKRVDIPTLKDITERPPSTPIAGVEAGREPIVGPEGEFIAAEPSVVQPGRPPFAGQRRITEPQKRLPAPVPGQLPEPSRKVGPAGPSQFQQEKLRGKRPKPSETVIEMGERPLDADELSVIRAVRKSKDANNFETWLSDKDVSGMHPGVQTAIKAKYRELFDKELVVEAPKPTVPKAKEPEKRPPTVAKKVTPEALAKELDLEFIGESDGVSTFRRVVDGKETTTSVRGDVTRESLESAISVQDKELAKFKEEFPKREPEAKSEVVEGKEITEKIMFHGSPKQDLTVLKEGPGGEHQRIAGIYLTKTDTAALKYTKIKGKTDTSRVSSVKVNLKNPASRAVLDEIGYKLNGQEMRKELIRRGYDGVIDDFMDEVVVFSSDQIEIVKPPAPPEAAKIADEGVVGAPKSIITKTPKAAIAFNVAETGNDFKISLPDGSYASGYFRNADFHNEISSLTRGELFFVKVKDKKQGIGASLALDAFRIMVVNGATHVNISIRTTEAGKSFAESFVRKGYISDPLRTSPTGVTEHEILIDKEGKIKPPQAPEPTIPKEPVPKAKPKAPTVPKRKHIGFAFIKNKQRPVLSTREITRGVHKGKLEVVTPDGKKHKVEAKAFRPVEEAPVTPEAKDVGIPQEIIAIVKEGRAYGLAEMKPLFRDMDVIGVSPDRVKIVITTNFHPNSATQKKETCSPSRLPAPTFVTLYFSGRQKGRKKKITIS